MKKTAEVKSLKAMGVADLEKKLAETRREIFTMRMKLADPTTPLVNVAALPAARRTAARINTLINQKKRESRKEKGA